MITPWTNKEMYGVPHLGCSFPNAEGRYLSSPITKGNLAFPVIQELKSPIVLSVTNIPPTTPMSGNSI